MIHEHEATELASAGIDFPLGPEDERELQRELADCPICAERSAAYREQSRMLARLPTLDASAAVRRRVTAAATTGRVERGSPMFVLVAAALLLALTLAVSAFVGAALLRPTPPELGLVDASSEVPVEPSPSVAATDGGNLTLAPGSIVEVVSGNLRVRSEPRVANDSTRFEPLLLTGDRLFIIDGPVDASDYHWYRVVPINTTANRSWRDLPSGWVSRGDHDGTPWVDAVPFRCPDRPVDIVVLSAMHPYERLTCFGSDDLRFRAVVRGASGQDLWAEPSTADTATDAVTRGPSIALDRDGEIAAADLHDGSMMLLEGGFDRPNRFDCRPNGALDPLIAEFDCRSVFVVSRATAER